MSYPEPMITISLKEYNDLQKDKQTVIDKAFEAKEDVKPYQKAISAMFGYLNPIT